MRLGDLDELLQVMDAFEPIVQGRHDGIGLVEHGTWAGLCEIVKDAPTIDAVPVVRCRDCKHRKTDECPLYKVEIVTWQNDELMPEWDEIEHDFTKDEGFCDRGERKDGEG